MKNIFIVFGFLFLLLFSNILSNQTSEDNFNQSEIEDFNWGQMTSQSVSDISKPSKEICDIIYSAMLGISVNLVEEVEGSFYDDHLKKYVNGCLLLISGTWSELGEHPDPINLIFSLLSGNGWSQYVEYSADGPDGTIFSFIKDDGWCIVKGQWNGGDAADSTYVPSDAYQIIVICGRLFDD